MMLTRDSSNVKAVFFDVGNTLIYPQPSVPQVFAEKARQFGCEVDAERACEMMERVDDWYDRRYAEDGDFWCSPDQTRKLWLSMYRMLGQLMGLRDQADDIAYAMYEAYTSSSSWRMFEDVQPCLQALRRRGVRVGVVSNWGSNLEQLLRSMGMFPYFDDVVASAVVGCRKPNPLIFRLACDRMGVAPEDCIHVGDLPDADGDGPSAVGIQPVLIDRKRSLQDAPYERMSSLRELIAHL